MSSPAPVPVPRQPAEWTPHAATWLAWPCDAALWGAELLPAQRAFVALCRAIAPGERLDVLVPDAVTESIARVALAGLPARYHHIPYGDIWLRDTGPIFVTSPPAARRFRYSGWGGRYVLPHDDRVAERIAAAAGVPCTAYDYVLEGGAVEVDGEGTCLTTRQCLLNENRGPRTDEATQEARLREALGATHVIWLDEGLHGDHTDGHVDNLARFVAPGRVVCMEPAGPDDPNAAVLRAIIARLKHARDAAGRRIEVITMPSPGRIVDAGGAPVPASYVNFYIANRSVAVPVYETRHDAGALATLGALFPGRRVVPIPARALLCGGGAFHCITQQQPAPP